MEKSKEQQQSIVEIQKGYSFGEKSGTVFQVTKAEIEPDALSNNIITGKPWAIWGKNNDYPQNLIDSNMQQETSAGALGFKIMAHYGKGLYFFRKEYKDNKEIIIPIDPKTLSPEIKSFYYNNDLPNFSQGIISDFEWFNFYYVQYIPNKLGTKIVEIDWKRTKDVRSAKRDPATGKIPSCYLSGAWPNPKANEIAELPVFNKKDPFAYANAVGKHQLVSIDKDYYPTAIWQSNTGWLKNAKQIPTWIYSNISNSVNIKYHVEIPEQYFIDLYPEQNYQSIDECLSARKKAESDLKQSIDDCLAGAENASKIFYTKFAVDSNGQPLPGWKINELTNELKDTAWLNAYNTAAAAICTAHSVDPELSGLRSVGALNGSTGSAIREKLNYHIQLKTVIPRQTSLEWWETVKWVNGWPEEIHLGYKDVILDTLDNAKSGFQVQHEESPTTK